MNEHHKKSTRQLFAEIIEQRNGQATSMSMYCRAERRDGSIVDIADDDWLSRDLYTFLENSDHLASVVRRLDRARTIADYENVAVGIMAFNERERNRLEDSCAEMESRGIVRLLKPAWFDGGSDD